MSSQTTMLRYSVLPACATSITGLSTLWTQVPFYGYTDTQVVSHYANFHRLDGKPTTYFVCFYRYMLSGVYALPFRPSHSQCVHHHPSRLPPPFPSHGILLSPSSSSPFSLSFSHTFNLLLFHIHSSSPTLTPPPPCASSSPNLHSQAKSSLVRPSLIRTGVPQPTRHSRRPCVI